MKIKSLVGRDQIPVPETEAPDFKQLRIVEVEISRPLSVVSTHDDMTGQVYERALILVRLHTQPLGIVELRLDKDGLSAEDCAGEIWRSLSKEIVAHLRYDGLPEPTDLGPGGLPSTATPRCVRERDAVLAQASLVSIVVATRDRAESLATCLESLLALEYPTFEIIVVDNTPSTSATADLIGMTYGADPRVRYVREDRPGGGWAHQRGLEQARGGIVAFTDDDVVVDRYWLAELVKGFSLGEQVGCVTGIAFPRELQTQAQMWFERQGYFSKGFTRRIFNLAEHRLRNPVYPYSAGIFGTGANMAFRTAALRAIGGFDPALGPGSPALGGEDLAAFFQIIMAGHTLVYEPGAIVYHLHRRDYAGLRKQMHGYGVGLTAYLTKCVIDQPNLIFDIAVRVPKGVVYAMRSQSAKDANKPSDYPRELMMIERRGLLLGPWAYMWGRWIMRNQRKQTKPPIGRSRSLTLPAPVLEQTTGPEEPQARDFQPMRILEVEIGRPLPTISPYVAASGQVFKRALTLVRLHTRPLGAVEVALVDGGLDAETYAQAIWRSLSKEIVAHLRHDGLPEPTDLGPGGLPSTATPRCVRERDAVLAQASLVSIVVATRDRAESLATCLESLLALEYPTFEIIVVDNTPSTSATADLIGMTYGAEPRVRYVREDRRGLGWARNRGLEQARGEIVAFTDDDVVVDRYWLAELVKGFSLGEQVGCVTGIAFPRELQTQAQMWFEQFGGFSKGYTRRIFNLTEHRLRNSLFPYAAGAFGTGANMAFRTAALRAGGGFDPALGAGSPTFGGEDLAAFFQIIMAGHTLVYEPSAIVHHRHRRDYAGLRKQVHGYGVGLTAYLTKCLVDEPDRVLDVVSRAPHGLRYALSSRSPKNAGKHSDYPQELTMAERRGLLLGPWAYMWGRWIMRNQRKQTKPPIGRSRSLTLPAPVLEQTTGPEEPQARDFQPMRILEVEIGRPLPTISPYEAASGQVFKRALTLVRLHTRPLGAVEVALVDGGLDAETYAQAIWRSLSKEIVAHLRHDGLPEPSDLGPGGLPSTATPRCVRERDAVLAQASLVSIVVATRDRAESLATCLESLLALEYPTFEIIVVDNTPSTSATADLIGMTYGADPRVRYVREDRPGGGWAHQRGLEQARGGIVAFTDDDVVVDRYWLAELVKGFSLGEQVGCVTGMIFPRELQTQAQMWIEQFGGFSKGYTRRIFNLTEHRLRNQLFPYAAGAFGSGANMAFRTAALRAIGGFDPALGPGSPGVGGEDLAAFFQIIMAGHTLVYEPGAIVHHRHRRDYAGLRKQVYGYGVGLAAYLTKCLVDKPSLVFDLAVRSPHGVAYTLSSRSAKNAGKGRDYPRELTALERKGMLKGPWAYIRGRWTMRKLKNRPGR